MKERQVILGLNILTGLVIGSIGIALASLTWRMFGFSNSLPIAFLTPGVAGDSVDIANLVKLSPFGTAVAAGDTVNVGSLHLKGTVLGIPEAASSALITGPDGKVGSYGIGATLGGGVIEAIQSDQVILRTPRGLMKIAFDNAAKPISTPVPAPDTKGTGFIPTGSPLKPNEESRTNHVSSRKGESVDSNPGGSGIRVTDASPAIFFAAGLQTGDVVEEINGSPVTANTSAEQIRQTFVSGSGAAQAKILRNGNTVLLRLSVHQ